jgi:hypothetical protein
VEHAGLDELVTPATLFLVLDLGKKLSEQLLFLLLVFVGNDVHQNHVLPAEFGALRMDILQADTESFITLDGVTVLVDLGLDADFNLSFGLEVFKDEGVLGVDVVDVFSGSMVGLIELNGGIVDAHDAVCSVLA